MFVFEFVCIIWTIVDWQKYTTNSNIHLSCWNSSKFFWKSELHIESSQKRLEIVVQPYRQFWIYLNQNPGLLDLRRSWLGAALHFRAEISSSSGMNVVESDWLRVVWEKRPHAATCAVKLLLSSPFSVREPEGERRSDNKLLVCCSFPGMFSTRWLKPWNQNKKMKRCLASPGSDFSAQEHFSNLGLAWIPTVVGSFREIYKQCCIWHLKIKLSCYKYQMNQQWLS